MEAKTKPMDVVEGCVFAVCPICNAYNSLRVTLYAWWALGKRKACVHFDSVRGSKRKGYIIRWKTAKGKS